MDFVIHYSKCCQMVLGKGILISIMTITQHFHTLRLPLMCQELVSFFIYISELQKLSGLLYSLYFYMIPVWCYICIPENSNNLSKLLKEINSKEGKLISYLER